jgi:hypothetical protein
MTRGYQLDAMKWLCTLAYMMMEKSGAATPGIAVALMDIDVIHDDSIQHHYNHPIVSKNRHEPFSHGTRVSRICVPTHKNMFRHTVYCVHEWRWKNFPHDIYIYRSCFDIDAMVHFYIGIEWREMKDNKLYLCLPACLHLFLLHVSSCTKIMLLRYEPIIL